MSDALHELYQNIILDHNKQPRNYGKPNVYTHSAEGYNPLCGDKVTLFLILNEGHLKKTCFESAACAICKASASMMTESLKNQSLQEAKEMFGHVRKLLLSDCNTSINPATDGDPVALAGVRKFPARIKCALLPWETLMNALKAER